MPATAVSPDTETVTCVVRGRGSPSSSAVTVTVRAAPVASSGTLVGETVSVTVVDADSSSTIVSVGDDGCVTPSAFSATPDTVTCLLSSSASLLTAVIVTVPVLAVCSAAIVSTLLLLSVKSSAVAGDTGDAETVTVVAMLDGRSRSAVTVLSPRSSLMRLRSRTRIAVGIPRSVVAVTSSE